MERVIDVTLKLLQEAMRDHPDNWQHAAITAAAKMVAQGIDGLANDAPAVDKQEPPRKLARKDSMKQASVIFNTGKSEAFDSDKTFSFGKTLDELFGKVTLSGEQFSGALGNFEEYPSLNGVIPMKEWAAQVHARVQAEFPQWNPLDMIKPMVLTGDKEGLYDLAIFAAKDQATLYPALLCMIKYNKLELVKMWLQLHSRILSKKHVLMNRSKALRLAINSADLDMLQFLMVTLGNCDSTDAREHNNLLLQRAALYDEDMCRWLCETYDLRGNDIKSHNYKALKCAKESDNTELMLYLAQRI